MVREVNAPALRILYDPANVLCHSDEDVVHTFTVQRDLIEYVHVKDFRLRAGERIACPVGEGDVPWPEIIRMLRESGFDGPLSYEYERKWNREQLPEPRVGLAQSIEYVKSLLEQ
jgi:sugar phosphate isomerase/epimerase